MIICLDGKDVLYLGTVPFALIKKGRRMKSKPVFKGSLYFAFRASNVSKGNITRNAPAPVLDRVVALSRIPG